MKEEALPQYDFINGAMLLVDKPLTWTSFDVVNKIRYALKKSLNVRKIKVGHAGTLDPLATGLLIICTGKYTKKLESYQALKKTYTGKMFIGATTPSFDKETEIDQTFPIKHIDQTLIENAKAQFTGEIKQYPPMFSAIKVDGQPLYKSARKGINVEIKPRPVSIYNFEINHALPELEFAVECSKGTYIRSLAYDFGKALRSGAYLTSLCRSQIGEHKLEDAWNLESLINHINTDYSPITKDQ